MNIQNILHAKLNYLCIFLPRVFIILSFNTNTHTCTCTHTQTNVYDEFLRKGRHWRHYKPFSGNTAQRNEFLLILLSNLPLHVLYIFTCFPFLILMSFLRPIYKQIITCRTKKLNIYVYIYIFIYIFTHTLFSTKSNKTILLNF